MPYRCAGCKHVHYCSHACQKDGWRTMHRYTCGIYQQKNVVAVPRGGVQSVGAKRARPSGTSEAEEDKRRKQRRLEQLVE